MNKLSILALALGLALGAACKKEDKAAGGDKDTAADKAQPSAAAKEPAPAASGKEPAPAATAKEPAPAAAAAAPAAGDGLTIAWKAPAVGATSETSGEMKMALQITPPNGAKPMDMNMTGLKKRIVEVLEVTGDFPSKVKVTYETQTELKEMMGKKEEEPSPLHGKAYVVWLEGGAVKATTADGGAVNAEEMKELDEDWYDNLGRVPGMAKAILARTWKQGETVTFSADELKDLSEEKRGRTVKAAKGTLQGVDGAIATFVLDMEVEQVQDGQPIAMAVKATFKVDAEKARPLGGTMEGTFDATMRGAAVKGTMKAVDTTTWK